MSSSKSFINLQLNTNNCTKCVLSRTNRSNSLQIKQNNTQLCLSNKKRMKGNRIMCYARFPLDEVKEMQRKLGIGGEEPVVEDQISKLKP